MLIDLDVFLIMMVSSFVLGVCCHYFADYYYQKKIWESKRREDDKKDFRLPKHRQNFDIIDDE